jgi:Holliday junction resolvase RusA-like endonuclease
MEYDYQTIHGAAPSKPNCYRIITIGGHGSLGKTAALKKYEQDFYLQVGAYRNLKLKDFFELHVRVFMPSLRQDLDNTLKIILDCLQKTQTIENDNRCVKIVAEKFVDKVDPRIEFRLVTIE